MKNNHRYVRHKSKCDKLAIVFTVSVIALQMILTACGRKLEGTVTLDNGNSNTSGSHSTAIDAAPIIERYRALDSSRDSTMKLRASIRASEGAGVDAPREIAFNIYRKRHPDGRHLILIEFTEPPEERDRDGLITVFPDGQVEGVRYVQSTDSYIVTRDQMAEDALFGMTFQEIADGQPEKYDFSILREEAFEGTECYRAEGKLKHGVESKFPRIGLLISKQSFALVKAEFYDNHNELARDLVVSKTEQIAGHLTRVRWSVDNIARRRKIDFEAVDVSYDQNLKDSIFTREHLKKIASR
jgi:Outer membrane lipoprotein-sorting protein